MDDRDLKRKLKILTFLFEQELKRGEANWQDWCVEQIEKLIKEEKI